MLLTLPFLLCSKGVRQPNSVPNLQLLSLLFLLCNFPNQLSKIQSLLVVSLSKIRMSFVKCFVASHVDLAEHQALERNTLMSRMQSPFASSACSRLPPPIRTSGNHRPPAHRTSTTIGFRLPSICTVRCGPSPPEPDAEQSRSPGARRALLVVRARGVLLLRQAHLAFRERRRLVVRPRS